MTHRGLVQHQRQSESRAFVYRPATWARQRAPAPCVGAACAVCRHVAALLTKRAMQHTRPDPVTLPGYSAEGPRQAMRVSFGEAAERGEAEEQVYERPSSRSVASDRAEQNREQQPAVAHSLRRRPGSLRNKLAKAFEDEVQKVGHIIPCPLPLQCHTQRVPGKCCGLRAGGWIMREADFVGSRLGGCDARTPVFLCTLRKKLCARGIILRVSRAGKAWQRARSSGCCSPAI